MLSQDSPHWRFQILSHLGHGGNSVVYRARDLVDGEEVALKVVPWPDRRQLIAEFRRLHRLRHPGLVRPRDLLLEEPEAILSLELLAPLDPKRFTEHPEEKSIINLWRQLASVLGHLHRRGLVHGDLKPENIGFQGGRAKLLDLGFCLRAGEAPEREFFGTPRYAPPEMLLENRRTASGDIYSLGLLLWELAGGSLPPVEERLDPEGRWKEAAPSCLSPAALQLLRSMLSFRYLDRPRDGGRLLWMMAEAGLDSPGEMPRETILIGRGLALRRTVRQLEAGADEIIIGCRSGRGASRFLEELKCLLQSRGHRVIGHTSVRADRWPPGTIVLEEAERAGELVKDEGKSRRRISVVKQFPGSGVPILSDIDQEGYRRMMRSVFPEAAPADIEKISFWLHQMFGGHLGLARQALEWLIARGQIEARGYGLRFHWLGISSPETLVSVSGLLSPLWSRLKDGERSFLKKLAVAGILSLNGEGHHLADGLEAWLSPGPGWVEFVGQAFRTWVLSQCSDQELAGAAERSGEGYYLSAAPVLLAYEKSGSWERWMDLALRVLAQEEARRDYEAVIILGTRLLGCPTMETTDARQILQRTLAACRRMGRFEQGLDILEQNKDLWADRWEFWRWRLVLSLGAGRYQEAAALAEAALRRWPDDSEIISQFRLGHGLARAYTGEGRQGAEEIREILSQAEERRQASIVRLAYEYLAHLSHLAGRWEEAVHYASCGLEAAGPGAGLDEIDTLTSILGSSLIQTGKAEEASAVLHNFLQRWEDVLSLPELARFHAYLGLAGIRLEDWSRATEHLRRAEACLMGEDLGYRAFIANNMAVALEGGGQHTAARKKILEAFNLLTAFGDRINAAICLSNLGLLENFCGRIGQAWKSIEDSLSMATDCGDARAQAIAYKNLGIIEFEQGNYGPARYHLEKSCSLCQNQPPLFDAVFYLGLSCLALNDIPGAEQVMGHIVSGENEAQEIMRRLLKGALDIKQGRGGTEAWFSELSRLWEKGRRRQAALLVLFFVDNLRRRDGGDKPELIPWLLKAESYFSDQSDQVRSQSAVRSLLAMMRASVRSDDRHLDRSMLDAFYLLADMLRNGAGPEQLGRAALERAMAMSRSERGGIFIIDETNKPRLLCGLGLDEATVADARDFSLQAFALASGREGEIVADDAQTQSDLQSRESIRRNAIRSLACISFKFQDGSGGALYLDSRLAPGIFSPGRKEFLRALASVVGALLDSSRLIESLKAGPLPEALTRILGSSPVVQEMKRRIKKAAAASVNIFIEGETGTGKELAAKAIHQLSERRNGPFVALDCGSLPESLLEAELFGHIKGAFTGAYTDRPGLFEAANGGTMFLDEITSASPAVQARLLRVVEEGEIRRVGDTRVRQVDVRLICASNKDIEFEIGEGRFKQDLYFRLNQFKIFIPPLRDRGSDIILLAEHFRRKYMHIHKRRGLVFSEGAKKTLLRYPWPGNIRELENTIQRAVLIAAGDEITERDLELPIALDADFEEKKNRVRRQSSVSKPLLASLLRECGYNTAVVAEKIGLSRRQVQRLMKKYDLAT